MKTIRSTIGSHVLIKLAIKLSDFKLDNIVNKGGFLKQEKMISRIIQKGIIKCQQNVIVCITIRNLHLKKCRHLLTFLYC